VTNDQRPEGSIPSGVLITTDPEFREQFTRFQSTHHGQFEVALDLERPFTDIGDPELAKIRTANADLVVIDLEADPHIGLKFVQFLIESGAATTVMCAGRDLSPELLLQAMQAGVSEILTKPVTQEAIDGALKRIWKRTGRKVEAAAKSGPGRAIALFGTKGGVGTTSLATNLAVEVHRVTRKKTLLLDLDVELGETSLMLGMDPQFSLTDLIRNFHRVDAGLLASYIEHHESGIDLLAAPFKPGDYEAVGQDRIRQIIRFLRDQYDFVIMDTPKSFHPVSIAVLEEADEILLVTTPTLPALRNLVRSLPLIRQITSQRKGGTIQLVVNRFEQANLISLKEIEETAGMPVLHSVRNDYEAVMTGINEGRPAVLRGQSVYAKSVRALAGLLTDTQVAEEDRRGLLGGFMGAFKSGR
jgi:pilus assembly protein CpaE